MMHSKWLKSAALLICGVFSGFFAFGGTEHVYTSAQTVNDVLTGDDSVKINISSPCEMSQGRTGWKIVTFTGANSFSGDVEVLSGCVAVSNLTALGTGRIKMSPGTAILIYVDFSAQEGGLTKQIIDRIDVVGDNLTDDTWVGFMIFADGLKNDVDFSSQPYLYLSALKHIDGYTNTQEMYSKKHTPYGDTYKFGCNFVSYTEAVSLTIGGLEDVDSSTPRKVIIRNGNVTFGSNIKFTGGVTVKKNGTLNIYNGTTFVAPSELKPNFFVFEDGSRFNPRWHTFSFDANYGWVFNGSVSCYPAGNTDNSRQIKLNGPVAGSGEIVFGDNGCFAFVSDNNTFTGKITTRGVGRTFHFTIGNNTNFSMGEVAFQLGNDSANPHHVHLKPKTSGSVFNLNYNNASNAVIAVEGSGSMQLNVLSNVKIANSAVNLLPLNIAAGKTYTFNDQGGYTAKITGTGDIKLAEGAVWPTLDLRGYGSSMFRIMTNAFDGVVVTCPTNVSVKMGGFMGPCDPNWTFSSPNNSCAGHTVHCFRTNYSGRTAFVLDDGCHWDTYSSAQGGIINNQKLDMSKVFSIDLDFYVESTGGSKGDLICIALQDQITSGNGYINGNGNNTGWCTIDGSVGLSAWPSQKKFILCYNKARVKTNDVDVVLSNPFGKTNYLFDNYTQAKPLHVNVKWDLTDIVYTLTWDGKTETVTYPSADLVTKFPSGAYVTFLSTAGGWYCRKIIDGLSISSAANPLLSAPGTGMTLKIDSTDAVFAEDGTNTFAGALTFKGTNTVSASKKVLFTNSDWAFDCSEGMSTVKFGSGVTLPSSIEVEVSGDDFKGWQTLIDYSAAENTPEIELTPASIKCRTTADRKFQIYGKVGSVILVM